MSLMTASFLLICKILTVANTPVLLHCDHFMMRYKSSDSVSLINHIFSALTKGNWPPFALQCSFLPDRGIGAACNESFAFSDECSPASVMYIFFMWSCSSFAKHLFRDFDSVWPDFLPQDCKFRAS
jgi:hypothetical protein